MPSYLLAFCAALRLAASGAQILVSTLMAAEPARRVSLMERISTRSAVVPAALEMAALYEICAQWAAHGRYLDMDFDNPGSRAASDFAPSEL